MAQTARKQLLFGPMQNDFFYQELSCNDKSICAAGVLSLYNVHLLKLNSVMEANEKLLVKVLIHCFAIALNKVNFIGAISFL